MHTHALVCSLTKFKNRNHGVAMTPIATLQPLFPFDVISLLNRIWQGPGSERPLAAQSFGKFFLGIFSPIPKLTHTNQVEHFHVMNCSLHVISYVQNLSQRLWVTNKVCSKLWLTVQVFTVLLWKWDLHPQNTGRDKREIWWWRYNGEWSNSNEICLPWSPKVNIFLLQIKESSQIYHLMLIPQPQGSVDVWLAPILS